MNAIIGTIVTFACVFGGYLWAGGKIDIILHSLPYEMMMIGGAAIGAFICGNDMHTIKATAKDLGAVFKGPKWKRQDYTDLLCLMHELVALAEKSPVDVEAHIEDPENSVIFQKYPVSYTHLTLPTILRVLISVVAASLINTNYLLSYL